MSWILEYFVVYLLCVYIWSAGYVEAPIVLLYLLWCLVYHMLSKTRRISRGLHRVIAHTCICYIYVVDAWCITCCWGISARFAAGGVIFHTAVVFLIQKLQLPVIFIHGFSRCRGYWIWVFCCLIVVCIYICSADYAELPVRLHLLQCLVYHMLSTMGRSSGIYI